MKTKCKKITNRSTRKKNRSSSGGFRRNESFITKLMSLEEKNIIESSDGIIKKLYSKNEECKKNIFDIIKKYEKHYDSIKKLNNSLDYCFTKFKNDIFTNCSYIIFEIKNNMNSIDNNEDNIINTETDKFINIIFNKCYNLIDVTIESIINENKNNESKPSINDITKLTFNYHKIKINMLLIILFEVKYLIKIKENINIEDEEEEEEKIIIGKSLESFYQKMYNILILLKKIKKEEFKIIITNLIEKKTQKQLKEPSLIITEPEPSGEQEKKPSKRGPSNKIRRIKGPTTSKQRKKTTTPHIIEVPDNLLKN